MVEDDSDEDKASNAPRVTRLDQASRVTFGGAAAKTNGGIINIEQPVRGESGSGLGSDSKKKIIPKMKKPATKTKTTRETLFENGADLGKYLWTQDISQIFITLFTDSETRAKDIKVSLTETGTLTVDLSRSTSTNNSNVENLLKGQLMKDVWGAPKARIYCKHTEDKQKRKEENESEGVEWESLGLKTNLTADRASESEKEDKELEWEIKDVPESIHIRNGRMIQIRLYKLPPHELIKGEWWDQLFLHDTKKFDTKTLKGRKNAHSDKANTFQQAWKEAHEKFIEKRKEGFEKIELPM